MAQESTISEVINYNYLKDYVGSMLLTSAHGTYKLEEVIGLKGSEVTYRLEGLNLNITSNINELINVIGTDYLRARTAGYRD